MKNLFHLAMTLGLGLSGLWFCTLSASALPMNGRVSSVAETMDPASKVETVRWVCPPYSECYWVPGRRAYGYWGGSPWGAGHWGGQWGHRHWGHGHGGHWGYGGHRGHGGHWGHGHGGGHR
jgi:hypothetical protein